MPPVFGPSSPSRTRLWSCATGRPIARRPSQTAKNDASAPVRCSSMTTHRPASPNRRSSIASRTACSAADRSGATVTPFPAASPSALMTTGNPNSPPATVASASSARRQTRKRAVGTACRAMNALAKALLDSSLAANRLGPNRRRPRASNRSPTPRASGSSGPTTVRSTASDSANASKAAGSDTSSERAAAGGPVPALPGAQITSRTADSRPSFQVSACSRAPLPTTSTFIDSAPSKEQCRRPARVPSSKARRPPPAYPAWPSPDVPWRQSRKI